MTQQHVLERLTAIENEAKELRKIIEQPENKSKEQRFWELMLQTDSIKIDKEKYPNSTFGFVGDEFLWEYDAETGYLWLSWRHIWSAFEKEYGMEDSDIETFVKKLVEDHFKCKGLTASLWVRNRELEAEEHFKCKGNNTTDTRSAD